MLSKLVRQRLRIPAEEMEGTSDIQPALIDPKGLYQVGVVLIYPVDLPG